MPDKKEESARDILDRRYARGEISREEYREMRKELE
ncbi:MAG: SHOCT domain-containing protein [Gammaproteobacteria bacterium]|nr:SHOCT domain-containing protein [Gammaproteobacteria bacterium]